MTRPQNRSTIAVFTLGGTISMAGVQGAGAVTRLSGADQLRNVPGLAELPIDVDLVDFRSLPSACLNFADLLELADAIQAHVAAGASGAVVVQGTDTIEETSYLLDLILPMPTPVVVTGAMRNPTLAGPDGPANLLAAIRVAADQRARHLGCLVVLNDEIHSARTVRKTHSTNPAAFASPDAGPVGHVVEGRVRMLTRPGRRVSLPHPDPASRIRVGLYVASLGDDGALLESAAEQCQGLVIAGFGVGHVPQQLAPVLEALAVQMPVVLASRTGAGPVLTGTYGFTGSETDLQTRGLINAGFLDPYKARVLLWVLLAGGADRDRVVEAFAAAG